jgi:hypothetical protein
MFFILLALQLSAILSQNINGISMALHTKMKMKSESTKNEPLYYPSDFIEYYIKLSVGTPAQDLLLMMDTGSNVVWAPCTTNYTCNNCHGYSTVFLPSKSSSAVPVQCADPKCKDVCGEGACLGSIHNCSGSCPDYTLKYGSGNTKGHLLTETFTLSLEDGGTREIKNFAVGCSVVSSGFSGIAGFGRGGLSMPSQLSPLLGHKFAYCLDDLNNSSMIVLGDMALRDDIPLTYTPFLNKSEVPSFRPYNEYYYIGLEGVSIAGKRLTLPSNLLAFDSKGNGGTIIDSGTSYTFFPEAIYKQILSEFTSQIGYRRVHSDLYEVCYNVSGVNVMNIQLPRFILHFKGGSDMVLPAENSFTAANGDNFLAAIPDTVCLAIKNAGSVPVGPAVVFGNFQQNNFYLLYDRQNNRLGFAQRTCKAFR